MTGTVPTRDRPTCPVSVVIPCYRCAATIGRAVESVAAQSLLPAELILVDDASDDDTLSSLRRLQYRYGANWIRIITNSGNSGAGAARNAGWDAAQSGYLAFLDADDAWHPQKLEIQLQFMLSHPEAALSGHGAVIDAAFPPLPAPGNIAFETVTFTQLLFANRFVTPSVMLKTSLPYRFRSGQRHMEDHLLWMQIATRGATVLRLGAELAVTFKPAYGASGLSSNLWQMEKAECGNYIFLAQSGTITRYSALALCAFSALKFLKRLIVVGLRR